MNTELALAKGTVVGGRYEILSILGGGGFGVTYQARDKQLNRDVAVKELFPADFVSRSEGSTVEAKSDAHREEFESATDRFVQEARLLAEFDHPNIVKVYDYFDENNTAYLVMHLEAGEPLSVLLKKSGPLGQEDVERYIMPIVDGLRAVHERDLIHRDIKPENIYINLEQNPILFDFGAARQTMKLADVAVTAIYTARYTPLEQYSSTGNIGPWTDLYALGAVIHKCITGTAPPDAPSRATEDTYQPLASSGITGFDRVFLKAVDWALEPSIERRPQSIDEWLRVIESKDTSGVPVPQSPSPKSSVAHAVVSRVVPAPRDEDSGEVTEERNNETRVETEGPSSPAVENGAGVAVAVESSEPEGRRSSVFVYVLLIAGVGLAGYAGYGFWGGSPATGPIEPELVIEPESPTTEEASSIEIEIELVQAKLMVVLRELQSARGSLQEIDGIDVLNRGLARDVERRGVLVSGVAKSLNAVTDEMMKLASLQEDSVEAGFKAYYAERIEGATETEEKEYVPLYQLAEELHAAARKGIAPNATDIENQLREISKGVI